MVTHVVLPIFPKIDVIAHLYLLEEMQGGELPFSFIDEGAGEEILGRCGQETYIIGVGERRASHRGYSSETRMAIETLGIILTDGNVRLMQLMDRENATGHLTKIMPYSIPWILRQAYRLGKYPKYVVRRSQNVIWCFLAAYGLKFDPKTLGGARALGIMPESAQKHFGPFTLSRYIRDMALLGYTEQAMFGLASWFAVVHDEAKQHQVAAYVAIESGQVSCRMICGRSGFMRIATNDPYVTGAAVRCFPLVVSTSESGHTVIMSSVFDLKEVGAELIRREPRWIYHERLNLVANGTESSRPLATGLSEKEVDEVVNRHARRKSAPVALSKQRSIDRR